MKTFNGVSYEYIEKRSVYKIKWPSGLVGFFKGTEDELINKIKTLAPSISNPPQGYEVK